MGTRRTFTIGEIDIDTLRSAINRLEARKKTVQNIIDELRDDLKAAIERHVTLVQICETLSENGIVITPQTLSRHLAGNKRKAEDTDAKETG